MDGLIFEHVKFHFALQAFVVASPILPYLGNYKRLTLPILF